MAWEHLAEAVQKRIPENILVVFVGIVLFGVLLLGFVYIDRSDRASEHEINQMMLATVKELRDQVVTFQKENDGLKAQLYQLKDEIQSMRNILMALESGNSSAPFAYWLKDRSGTVLYANNLYESTFLSCRGYNLIDYINHTDFDVWPEEVASTFKQNDAIVVRTGKVLLFSEPVLTCSGEIKELTFVKWPRKIGNYTVGIAGMYLPSQVDVDALNGAPVEQENLP